MAFSWPLEEKISAVLPGTYVTLIGKAPPGSQQLDMFNSDKQTFRAHNHAPPIGLVPLMGSQITSHLARPSPAQKSKLYCWRGRKGSGDLPGLQSRRFGPSRVEWWIRLPHASAKVLLIQLPLWELDDKNGANLDGFWTQVGPKFFCS